MNKTPLTNIAPEIFRKRLLIEGYFGGPKFLSTIIYTCGEFDEHKAVDVVKEFFEMGEMQTAIF